MISVIMLKDVCQMGDNVDEKAYYIYMNSHVFRAYFVGCDCIFITSDKEMMLW